MNQNVYIIGRHTPDLGEEKFTIVGQENIMFPATANKTLEVLKQIEISAIEAGASVVLLQNTPGQVASAMITFAHRTKVRWGVVISKPAQAEAGVVSEFTFENPEKAMEAIKAANPRASIKIEGKNLVLTVDPPRKFEFDHIEWLNDQPSKGQVDVAEDAEVIFSSLQAAGFQDVELSSAVWEAALRLINGQTKIVPVSEHPLTHQEAVKLLEMCAYADFMSSYYSFPAFGINSAETAFLAEMQERLGVEDLDIGTEKQFSYLD